MTVRRLSGVILLATCLAFAAVAGPDTTAPSAPEASGVASLDLHGKPDTTPLTPSEQGGEGTPFVNSPPQTVEGKVAAIDPAGTWIEVGTRDGVVKIGLPPNATFVRNGRRNGVVGDIKVGDRFYATVVTRDGPRAIYVVTDPPDNPLVSWVGVPVLLLVAAWIWHTGRPKPSQAPPAKTEAQPTS
jgi:hypothetical protein